jgi:hypothetical protein
MELGVTNKTGFGYKALGAFEFIPDGIYYKWCY